VREGKQKFNRWVSGFWAGRGSLPPAGKQKISGWVSGLMGVFPATDPDVRANCPEDGY